MHGGSISVKSEVGKGTTFIVRIPTDLKAEGFVDAGSESAPELEIETAEGLVQTEKRHIMELKIVNSLQVMCLKFWMRLKKNQT